MEKLINESYDVIISVIVLTLIIGLLGMTFTYNNQSTANLQTLERNKERVDIVGLCQDPSLTVIDAFSLVMEYKEKYNFQIIHEGVVIIDTEGLEENIRFTEDNVEFLANENLIIQSANILYYPSNPDEISSIVFAIGS